VSGNGGAPKGNRNAMKHGAYALRALLDGKRKLDGRSALAKVLKGIQEQLVRDLGAERWDDLSQQQKMLTTRVLHKHLFCLSVEAWALKHTSVIKKGQLIPALANGYLALANSLRLDLALLGMKRRERDVESLASILAAHEEASGSPAPLAEEPST